MMRAAAIAVLLGAFSCHAATPPTNFVLADTPTGNTTNAAGEGGGGASSMDELAHKYGSDKAQTVDSNKGTNSANMFAHGYTKFYPTFLEGMRDSAQKIMELGTLKGASTRMWRDYFPNAHMYAADIEDKSALFAGPGDKNRVTLINANQEDRDSLKKALAQVDGQLDMFIDDGGHSMLQQLTTLSECLEKVRPGGVYILEDLHTSQPNVDVNDGKSHADQWGQSTIKPTALEVIKALRDGTKIESSLVPNLEEIRAKLAKVELWSREPTETQSVTSVLVLK